MSTPWRRYRAESRLTRLHLQIRWWAAPFDAVVAALPDEGTVLDVGCGHGLLALAAARPLRPVVGVDVDPDRIAAARRAADGNARFEVLGELPDGPFAAITVVDVLYLLPPERQRALLHTLADRLEPSGRLVVKEMGVRPRWKVSLTRAQEWLATGPVGLTTGGDEGLWLTPPDVIGGWLAEEGLHWRAWPVDRRRPWPHALLVASPTPAGLP